MRIFVAFNRMESAIKGKEIQYAVYTVFVNKYNTP